MKSSWVEGEKWEAKDTMGYFKKWKEAGKETKVKKGICH